MDRPSATASPHVVAVIGLGTMGSGIAEVLVRAGHEVVGIDISEPAAAAATAALEHSTRRAVDRGRLTETERDRRAGQVPHLPATSQAAAEADLVIEVVAGVLRRSSASVFTALDAIVRPDAILATGTNALSVTRLAAETTRPERVLGLHFFAPAQAMKLVEVVSTVLTAPEATADGDRAGARRSARSRCRSATGPASSPTGCCSATSTRPRRCTRRATPPGRTSTRRCGWAAGCRWARWRCWT